MKTVIAVCSSVIASLLFNYAVFLNKKAVADLPEVGLKLSFSTLKAFLTNRLILAMIGFSLVGTVFYVVAITLAPISVVQPIVGSGVVLLAYLAIKNLGESPRRVDFFAIGINVLGVVLLGASLAEGIPEKVKHSPEMLWILVAVIVGLAVIVPLISRGSSAGRLGASLGVTVGLLYGIAAVFSRLMFVDWANRWSSQGITVLFSSIFLLAWAASFFPAVVVLQAALQKGLAVVVVPVLAGISQLVPIFVGMVALNEPFPENFALSAIRVLGFCLILTGSVILSRRAEETVPGS